jgi:hypothetical protein
VRSVVWLVGAPRAHDDELSSALSDLPPRDARRGAVRRRNHTAKVFLARLREANPHYEGFARILRTADNHSTQHSSAHITEKAPLNLFHTWEPPHRGSETVVSVVQSGFLFHEARAVRSRSHGLVLMPEWLFPILYVFSRCFRLIHGTLWHTLLGG